MRALELAIDRGRRARLHRLSITRFGGQRLVACVEERVELGTRSPLKLDLYRHAVEKHVAPACATRLGELTVPHCRPLPATRLPSQGLLDGEALPRGAVGHLSVGGGGAACRSTLFVTPRRLSSIVTGRRKR